MKIANISARQLEIIGAAGKIRTITCLMEESKRINDSIARIMAVKVKHLSTALREGQRGGMLRECMTTIMC